MSEVGRQLAEAVTRGHGESLSGVRGRGSPEVHHALPVTTVGPHPRDQGRGAQVQHALLPLAAVKSSTLVKTISKLMNKMNLISRVAASHAMQGTIHNEWKFRAFRRNLVEFNWFNPVLF